MSATDRWRDAWFTHASRPLIRFEGGVWTYAQIDGLAAGYAAELQDRGISAGDRVAVVADTHPDVVIALQGHHRAGVVHVPVNTRYRAEEIRHILTDADPALVLVDAAHADVVHAADPGRPVRRIGGSETFSVTRPSPPVDVDAAAAALMIYTSGTTGKSKGVVLSYGAVFGSMAALTDLWQWSASDRLVLALPVFHVHGLCIGLHGSVLNGLTIDLLAAFSPDAVVEHIGDGGTVFMGVPTMYRRLVDHLDSDAAAGPVLGRARLFTSGSAPLNPDLFTRFERHTGHQIVERYGMSETLITLSNRLDGVRRPGVVGEAVPGFEARVVDEEGRPVSPGEAGELEVRGVGLMTSYWQRAKDTAASFRSDGWFRTGDIARWDAPPGTSAAYQIVGRKSVDVIKSGGFKISAREIEDVLREHDAVDDVAVVGVPDPEWGQTIAAAVVLSTGHVPTDDTRDSLIEWSATHLADFKKPRMVRFVDALPTNALGKVQKHRLVPDFDVLRRSGS